MFSERYKQYSKRHYITSEPKYQWRFCLALRSELKHFTVSMTGCGMT